MSPWGWDFMSPMLKLHAQCGTQLLLLPTDQDAELSAPSPAPRLLYAAMPTAVTITGRASEVYASPVKCVPV